MRRQPAQYVDKKNEFTHKPKDFECRIMQPVTLLDAIIIVGADPENTR
jgi:hypothetical protein